MKRSKMKRPKSKQGPLVSVIVRTKNEERWIAQTLDAVFGQSYKNFEVILVDNESADRTIEKAKQFPVKRIVSCREYLPGHALNIGIRQSAGEYLIFISGHCIPASKNWLENLLNGFADKTVAGVYGRQEPMSFTSNADKRDLALVFGLDRKIQAKDSFFHNANSAIRKDVWEKIPFDEHVTNIEDRVWAKEVLKKGYKIVYEPEASVYHYHGIHQNGNAERCANVVRILDSHREHKYKSLDIEKMNIIAIVPVRGAAQKLGNKPLMAYTINRALESKYIKKVVVSTDNAGTAALAKKLGAEAPFLRDPAFSRQEVNLGQVFKHSLEKIEERKIFPDLMVCLEITFPFRPKNMIDDMIVQLAENGLDSVVAARPEHRAIWKEEDGRIIRIVEGMTPRQFKEPTFVELRGVGCVTHPAFVRGGDILGTKIGIYQLQDAYSHLEVRSPDDFKMASILSKNLYR